MSTVAWRSAPCQQLTPSLAPTKNPCEQVLLAGAVARREGLAHPHLVALPTTSLRCASEPSPRTILIRQSPPDAAPAPSGPAPVRPGTRPEPDQSVSHPSYWGHIGNHKAYRMPADGLENPRQPFIRGEAGDIGDATTLLALQQPATGPRALTVLLHHFDVELSEVFFQPTLTSLGADHKTTHTQRIVISWARSSTLG